MKGNNTFTLNAATMMEALQEYFTKSVFDPSQIVKVKSIKQDSSDPYSDQFIVEVECGATDVDVRGAK